jgi:hypothetical protein
MNYQRPHRVKTFTLAQLNATIAIARQKYETRSIKWIANTLEIRSVNTFKARLRDMNLTVDDIQDKLMTRRRS